MTRLIMLASALAAVAALACTSTGAIIDESDPAVAASEEALRAASPACVMAHDACRAQAQPIFDKVKAACADVQTACQGGAGGGMVSTACSDARTACKAAIDAAKPELQAVGQQCQPAVQAACLPPGFHGADGGVSFGHDGGGPIGPPPAGHDGGVPPGPVVGHDAGSAGGGVSQACSDAKDACQKALTDVAAMPPASCAAVPTACTGSSAASSMTECQAAIDACRTDAEAIVKAVQQHCGADLVAACRRR